MVNMITLNSRDEWLKYRKNRIGGSDAAAILGKSPYMSNVDLWKIKTGQTEQADISGEEYVQYGNAAEPHLRELFKLDYQGYEVKYCENNMFLNDKYPFAHASLDGWLQEKETGRRGILEIKTSEIMSQVQKSKWNGRIPDNYYVQILHYLMVTEFDFVKLKAHLRWNIDGEVYIQERHYNIERSDVRADIDYLEASERRFYEQIIKKECPALILPEI